MSIEQIYTVIPSPEDPIETPDQLVWDTIELDVHALPSDYRLYIESYGTGCVDGFIWVFNPGAKNANLNLSDQVRRYSEVLDEINESGLEARIPIFPEVGGVLPFGVTDNGDLLLWVTEDHPDRWIVAVLPSRGGLIKYDTNMTGFLAGVCSGSIVCKAFPTDFPSRAPVFSPRGL